MSNLGTWINAGRRRVAFCLLAGAACLVVAPSYAALLTSNSTGPNSVTTIDGDVSTPNTKDNGQTFRYTGGSGTYMVTNVVIMASPKGGGGPDATIHVHLRTAWGSGTLYTTNAAEPAADNTLVDFPVDPAVELTDGTTYYLRISATGGGVSFDLPYGDPTTYNDGDLLDSSGSPQSGKDTVFYVYGYLPLPEIDVYSNTTALADGDTSATVSEGTDFGGVDPYLAAVTNTLTITNTGLAVLNLTGTPVVNITGDTGDFSADTSGISTNIAVGESTTFKLIFNPTATGTRTGVVSIASDDSDENPYDFYIQGTGTVSDIEVVTVVDGDTTPSPGELTDFGDAYETGAAVTNTFTITNNGVAILFLTGGSGSEVTLTTGTDFSVDTTGIDTNLAPGESTTFKVVFDPTTTGTRSDAISIPNNDPGENPYNFDIQGNGLAVGPEMEVTTVIDGDATPSAGELTGFGGFDPYNASATNTLTITNTGVDVLYLTGSPVVDITGHTGDFSADTSGIDTNLAPGESTTFKLIFDPTVSGTRTGVVSIANNDSDENPYDFYIQGTGTDPDIEVVTVADGDTTPSLGELTDFGNVTEPNFAATNTLTITNVGPATLLLTGGSGTEVSITGHTSDFTVDTSGIDTNLAPGESTTFKLIFDPTALGTRTGVVSIANNDSGENPYDFYIQGEGVAPVPEINVTTVADGDSTPTVGELTDFGDVFTAGYVATNTLTIENAGPGTLYLTGGSGTEVSVSGSDFSVDTTGIDTNLASGESTTFKILFDPSATGLRTGSISIPNDDSDENPYNFDIQGTGVLVDPDILVTTVSNGDTSPTLTELTDFGTVNTTGYAVTNSLTITNAGNYTLNLSGDPVVGITGDTGDFTAVTTSTDTNIASGATTTFDIVFDPTTTGTRTGIVSIASSDTDANPYTFYIQGEGTLDEPNGGIPFSETFEASPSEMAGTPGDVDGQHGWNVSTSGAATVQSVAYEGSQGLCVSNTAVSNLFYDISATNVIWEFWARPPLKNGVPSIPANATCVFYVNASSNVVAYSGVSPQTLSGVAVTNNAWTRFTVEADYVTRKWDLSVNGASVISNASFYSAGSGYVNGMMYLNELTGTCTYVDNVALRPPGISPYTDSDGDGVINTNEIIAGTDINDANSYLRIVSGDFTNSADVVLNMFLGANKSFKLLASTTYGGPRSIVMGVTNSGSAGFYDIVDSNAANEAAIRFYSIATAGREWTNAVEWAMYSQERAANERYLVSAPVKYASTNENNLNSTLGRHLANGLYASADTNLADRIEILDGTWSTYYLVPDGGDTYWWDPDGGGTADVHIANGAGMWIVRGSGSPSVTNGVFVGRPRSESDAGPISFTADAWSIFSWALPTPKQHVNLGASTPSNQLGLAAIAVGGTSSDPAFPEKHGDQIWVWQDNTWKKRYWLVNNYDASGDAWNGRWWDSSVGDFADFQLEAGKAYYYKHVTNMYGGTNFTWSPGY